MPLRHPVQNPVGVSGSINCEHGNTCRQTKWSWSCGI